MKKKIESEFGARLREAFGNAKNAEIARRLGVSEPAVKNYMEGRVPPSDTLVKIADLTNCSLHWLLTGEGMKTIETNNGTSLEKPLEVGDEDEAEMAALFFNYKKLTPEDKAELRKLIAFVDEEIERRKNRNENSNLTADKARLE
ncbi:MAG TPA: helix-turn-helix domain-containing protein [Blastocatellia bacterium]|nr:helix-turn-helix domain-containing protein [Blastocatellia bacterium]